MEPLSTLASPNAAGAALQGLLLMGGLIVAIGAQNALVLRQGLLRQHVVPVVLLCIASDWALSAAGVFGLGAWISASPALMALARYFGSAFLLWCALQAGHRAWTGGSALQATSGGSSTLAGTLLTAAAVTWLNPHVYLDTVVLLGAVGAQHGTDTRWAFLAGAAAASALWFTALGAGAVASSRWLQRPGAWRAIDAGIALVMLAVAVQLLY